MISLTWQCVEDDDSKITKELIKSLETDPSFFCLYLGKLYNSGKGAMYINGKMAHPNEENEKRNKENIIEALTEYEQQQELLEKTDHG